MMSQKARTPPLYSLQKIVDGSDYPVV